MTIVISRTAKTDLPIEVPGITPDQLADKSDVEIRRLPIWQGNQTFELGELFEVSGMLTDSQTIVWEGELDSVHWIGAEMSRGKIQIKSNAGRHIGSRMSGGEIQIAGNVSDFLGCEMTGGSIRVAGNSGDLTGGVYPGSPVGMNRGSILIEGNAGKGAGQSMRRGTLVVGGDTGSLTGWNMLAGTIMVLGKPGPHVGNGMTRGTIVLAGGLEDPLLPTFIAGGVYPIPVLSFLANWLGTQDFHLNPTLVNQKFQQFDGDTLHGGRGEIFVKQ